MFWWVDWSQKPIFSRQTEQQSHLTREWWKHPAFVFVNRVRLQPADFWGKSSCETKSLPASKRSTHPNMKCAHKNIILSFFSNSSDSGNKYCFSIWFHSSIFRFISISILYPLSYCAVLLLTPGIHHFRLILFFSSKSVHFMIVSMILSNGQSHIGYSRDNSLFVLWPAEGQ